ncbi:hypothetical protein, partial [Novosphingobium sp. SCN 63-17]|uniref:hypothetical protein n=1 Tax=Novosphingobium sp. SCN 63-17 TaxID=1660120 RepID=UPI0025F765AF
SQGIGNTPDLDRLITHVTVTSRTDPLFGLQLEVLQLVSDRGSRWVTVRTPNGSRKNICRTATDLVEALPDSKSTPLVSGAVLLRVVRQIEALSLHLDEDSRNDENERRAADAAECLDSSAGTDTTKACSSDRAGITRDDKRSRR